MKKFLRWLLIISISLGAILFVTLRVLRAETKKHSPEETIVYTDGDLELSVYYNRPYKKGRKIFGDLVPYKTVWRTGANEATTFTTNKELYIAGKILDAGKYTLWTIPDENNWQIIFNEKQYGWGVRMKDGKASRNPEFDALTYQSDVESLNFLVDQFTISFQKAEILNMVMEWDTVRVSIPIEVN